MRRDAAVAALTMLVVAVPATSAWATEPAGDVSAAEAGEVLDTAVATVAPEAAPAGAVPATDASVALHDLAAVAPELGDGDRRRANALLARPTDGSGDQYGDGYPNAADVASASSPNFCAFWVSEAGFPDSPDLTDANGSGDGDGVPDYVEEILSIAEFSHSVEVAPGAMGWRDAKPDKKGCGSDPSARTDIYLKQLGTLFGYASVDPGQGRKRSQYAYLVLDDDYAPSEYPAESPLTAAAATVAHEYNHVLQFAYDAFQDVWVGEATATWAEERVYPANNDYLRFVPAFAEYPGTPVTTFFPPTSPQSRKIYGAATWNHWLDVGGGGYGPGAIRRVWELSDAIHGEHGLAAYDRAIDGMGGKSFGREWAAFAAATAEWRTGYGGLPDAARFPDVRRKGSLSPGKKKSFKLDHTGYRLIDMGSAGGDLTVSIEAERGVLAAVALVARDGDALSGTVTRKLKYLKKGGSGSVTLTQADQYERITAVVVNADDGVEGYAEGDWVYAGDNAKFTVERG